MTLYAPAKGLKGVEQVFTQYTQNVPESTSFEDLLRPEFWSHHAATFKPMDLVYVTWDGGAHWALLLVLSKGVGYAKMKLLLSADLHQSAAEETDPLCIVKWRSPQSKYGVIRKSDGVLLKDGFGDKGDAETFARDYERTVAA